MSVCMYVCIVTAGTKTAAESVLQIVGVCTEEGGKGGGVESLLQSLLHSLYTECLLQSLLVSTTEPVPPSLYYSFNTEPLLQCLL